MESTSNDRTGDYEIIHSEHGLICSGLSYKRAQFTTLFFPKKFLSKCRVARMKNIIPVKGEPFPGPPDLETTPPVEDIDTTPAKDTRESIADFAKRFNLKTTEVLMTILGWGHEGVHVNTKLKREVIDQLELFYAKKLFTEPAQPAISAPFSQVPVFSGSLGVAEPKPSLQLGPMVSGSLPWKQSPHQQPPFQPKPIDHTPSYDVWRRRSRLPGTID